MLVFAQEVTFNFLHFIYTGLLLTNILNNVIHTFYIPSPMFFGLGLPSLEVESSTQMVYRWHGNSGNDSTRGR